MSRSVHATLHRFFGEELSELLDTVLIGDVVTDRATAERLVRSIGALVHLYKRHTIDARGRCALCWPMPRHWWRPWPRRSTCSVHAALIFYLRHPPSSCSEALISQPALRRRP